MSDEPTGVIPEAPPVSEVLEAGPQEPSQGGQVQEPIAPAGDPAEALRVERERLRNAELENQWLRQRLQASEQQPQQPQQQETEYQPEDFATYGDIDKIIEKRLGSVQEEARARATIEQERVMRASNPDWDDVVRKVRFTVSETDWGIMLNDKNPAEYIYNWGKKNLPEYAQSVTQDIQSQIRNNLSRPPTLSDVPGQTPSAPGSELMDLPRDKFLTEIDKLMNG